MLNKRDEPTPSTPMERLEHLLDNFQNERRAIEAALSSVQARDISSMGTALEEADGRAATLASRLDELGRRAEQILQTSRGAEALEARIASLEEMVRNAETRSQQAAAESDDRHRALRDATAAAQETLARWEHARESGIDALREIDAKHQDTSAQLQALNALAERVSTKAKALEGQHQAVERALVESRRVGEMVWEMEAQIAKLNEGSPLASRVEEDLARLERLHAEVTAKLEDAARGRAQFTERADQQQRDAIELIQAMQGHVDRLTVRKKELDTAAERLRAVQGGLSEAERRLTSVSSAEKTMAVFGERLDALSSRINDAAAQAEALSETQSTFSLLAERLTEMERIIKGSATQMDALMQRQPDLDALGAAFESLDTRQAAARALVDELRGQQEQFAEFVARARDFMSGVPEMDGAISTLGRDLADVRTRASETLAIAPRLDELDHRLTAFEPRLELAEDLHGRLSTLRELSAAIDQKLTAQLARQGEIDQLRVACDGVATQTAEARQQLQELEHAQASLTPLAGRLSELDAGIAAARERLASLQRDHGSIDAQERRLAELEESGRRLFAGITARLESMEALKQELHGADGVKEQVYAGIAQLQALQREADTATRTMEDHLQQLAARWQQIEERRSQLSAIERAIAAVESRSSAIDEVAANLAARLESLAERERVVQAVKDELDTVHEIARKSQEDLAAVTDRRGELTEARTELERIATMLVETRDKITEVQKRSAAVEEVRRKADAAVGLLNDVRVTLDAVGEQKAMVDHVSEMLARLDTVLGEARGTVKSLQAERKLAEKIAQNVRDIHARAGI
jgi:chromosome segregation ATPase